MPSTSNQNSTADVPTYASSDPNKLRNTKCVPGPGFIKTLFGLFNLIIIVSRKFPLKQSIPMKNRFRFRAFV